MSNVAKNFGTLATSLNSIIILMVQQNYFSDLYPAKILDPSAKLFSFFPYSFRSQFPLSPRSIFSKMTNSELCCNTRGNLIFLVREGPRPSIGRQLPNTTSQIMHGIGLESFTQPSVDL